MVKRQELMINDTDMELVDLAKGGDERSFEDLIHRHYQSVYQLSYKWCRIKEDAEEITQDVFIKLGQRLTAFNGNSSFRTWLYRITINTAKDYSRKISTKRLYESTYAADQSIEKADDASPGPINAEQVYDAIDMLPEKQKAAIMLVMAEGLSHKEAARILECPEATVSWRIHQGRKALKRHFSRMV
jgi:RNA polymerase sigma-70 factor, ECF subfamily